MTWLFGPTNFPGVHNYKKNSCLRFINIVSTWCYTYEYVLISSLYQAHCDAFMLMMIADRGSRESKAIVQ